MPRITGFWKNALHVVPALALAAALSACPSLTAPPLPPQAAPSTGSLTVNVIGLPSGVNSSVSVSGPGGFSQALISTKTLDGLTPGSYTVASSNVTSAGVTYAGTVTGSPVTVKAGATAASSVTYSSQTGILSVSIAGLPAGVSSSVTVTGPGGFSQNLTTSQILTGLNLGTYTLNVSSKTVRAPGPNVDALYDGSGNTTTVTAGAVASMNATYVQRPGTGRLWLPLASGQVGSYTVSMLSGASLPQPGVFTSPNAGTSEAVALDAEGNLWVAASASQTLEKFTPAQLATTGKLTAAVTITASTAANFGALSTPSGLAFDKDGSLWVTNLGNNTVVKFTSGQLAASGAPLPAVTISSNAAFNGSLNQPNGLAFDRDGNLWVTNRNGSQPIVKYTPTQQAAGGVVTPSVAIGAKNGSLNFPMGLAFDKDGNLWVANNLANTLVMFLPIHIASSGSPDPDETIGSNANSLKGPVSLAFDASGNLWVANLGSSTLVEFKTNQFVPVGGASIRPTAVSISPVPSLTIATGLFSNAGFAFDPPPTNLPIAQVK